MPVEELVFLMNGATTCTPVVLAVTSAQLEPSKLTWMVADDWTHTFFEGNAYVVF